jgi:hypothetical protein
VLVLRNAEKLNRARNIAEGVRRTRIKVRVEEEKKPAESKDGGGGDDINEVLR